MTHYRYKVVGIVVAALFWLVDSVTHKFFYGEEIFEWIPSSGNELWMRTAIVVLLVSLGAYTDYHTARLLREEDEKLRVYTSTISVSHHILHNFLNKMQLFRLEAERSADFNKSRLALYDQVIAETSEQIKRLEAVSEISEEGIKAAVFPS